MKDEKGVGGVTFPHSHFPTFPLFTLPALVAILLAPGPASAAITDPAYHTLAEVNERLFDLQDSLRYEDSLSGGRKKWMRIDSIGYSQNEKRPIYCVRITDNVDDTTLSKPAVMYWGQNHAEEVLGVEFCLWLIPQVLANARWRNNVDTYIIPTSNPDGLNAVYMVDYTYRKNKRDNIGDGRFRYRVGWGMDTSGVDLNRNFPLFWVHGSPILTRGTTELYDYYRGPGPLSEPEAVAVDRLVDRIRPLYSVVLHSSRTGKVAEQVIYPWHYGNETKPCPDQETYDALANAVAQGCRKYGQQDKTYVPTRILNAQGDCESYLYWRYGTFAIRVEIGAEGEAMQPDSAGIYTVINDVRQGMEHLLNTAADIATNTPTDVNRSRLDIRVTDDAVARKPLEARLHLPSFSKPMIPFRSTNPRNGRYYWPIWNGFSDTLTVSCYGYKPLRRRVSGDVAPTWVPVSLNPLPRHQVTFLLDDGALPVATSVDMEVSHPDSTWETVIVGGRAMVELPEGEYVLTFVDALDYVPRRVGVTVAADTTFHVSLSPAIVLLDQSFDGADIVLTRDNIMNDIPVHTGLDSLASWELTDDVYHTPPRSLTDRRFGDYLRQDDAWAAPYNLFDEGLDLSGAKTAALVYWLNQALEPGCDSMCVEVAYSSGGDPASWNWTQAAPSHQELSILTSVPERPWNANPISYQRFGAWKRFVVPLDSFCGRASVQFRFRLRTDATIEEDGVYIDDVMVLASGDAPPAVSSLPTIPIRFAMSEPFPNPFNSRFLVRLALPMTGRTRIMLYDLTGRVALMALDDDLSTGARLLTIDAGALPTGLYLLRAVGPDGRGIIRKITLIK